jgi:hypothetical protein
MAHAILFVDRAPRTKDHDNTTQYYTHSAGAYKIASVLREIGLDVLVVPNCLNLTFAGVKHIIDQNKQNLLWVGLSTTFFVVEVHDEILTNYRKEWTTSDSLLMDADQLCKKWHKNLQEDNNLVWGVKELGRLSHYVESQHKVPFLVGGAYADFLLNAHPRHRNTHIVTGYAETYVKEFTESLLTDLQAKPPMIINNNHYDNVDYKHSKIIWRPEDFIDSDDWLPIEVARGCAFNCAYCNYSRRGEIDSYKNPKVLYDELIRNYELYGVTKYMLVDDLYNDSKEKVRILHDQVWSKLPFKPEWVSFMRLDMMWKDPDSAKLIQDSGCRYAAFGIETLHDVAGKKVGKGLGRKRILDTLEMLKELWGQDTLVNALMIAGLPFEPIESIQDSMEWTLNTDLIHSPNWSSMYLTPPTLEIFGDKNRLDSNFDKFGVSWIDENNWVNSAGVSKQMVDELVSSYADRLSTWKMRFTMSIYIDMRVAGFSHEQISNFRNVQVSDHDMENSTQFVKNKIFKRLNKIISINNVNFPSI